MRQPLHVLEHPREAVRNFTPNWFTVTMGTGILALMLAKFPYHVPGLVPAGRALWVLNLLLFAVASLLFVARFAAFPREALASLEHPVESMFLGAIPMGLATLVNGTVAFAVPRFGHAAVTAAQVGWWADVSLSVVCGLLVPYLMFTRQDHGLDRMTATWLLPIVPAEVAAASGGQIAPLVSAAAARTIEYTSYVLWALSVPLALAVLTILFLRLALHKLPPRELGVTGWLTLGPLGTGSFGLLLLGVAAPRAFAGTPLAALGPVADGVGLLGGLALWAYGLWWWVTAAAGTLRFVREGGLPFNMGWWGFTFPLGVYTAATLTLGHVTGFAPFTVFGALLVLLLAGLWGIVALHTLRGAWHGHLFRVLTADPELDEEEVAA